MSDQHDQHDEVTEDERLEADRSHDERVGDEPADTKPSEGEVGYPVPSDPVEDEPELSWQDERYERAALDPEYAVQQGIVVDEDDQGPAYKYGSLAAYEDAQRAEAAQDDSDHDDDSEEV